MVPLLLVDAIAGGMRGVSHLVQLNRQFRSIEFGFGTYRRHSWPVPDLPHRFTPFHHLIERDHFGASLWYAGYA